MDQQIDRLVIVAAHDMCDNETKDGELVGVIIVPPVGARLFACWTILTCAACATCAFNLDNTAVFNITFFSFAVRSINNDSINFFPVLPYCAPM
jgi:hypothetical protein